MDLIAFNLREALRRDERILTVQTERALRGIVNLLGPHVVTPFDDAERALHPLGEPIKDGVEIPGLGKAAVDVPGKLIKVDKIMRINNETIAGLIAGGL